jgi:hypothetical protein
MQIELMDEQSRKADGPMEVRLDPDSNVKNESELQPEKHSEHRSRTEAGIQRDFIDE